MRPNARLLAAAIIAHLGLSACEKPSYIEIEPKDHTFKRVGEDVWWHAKARTRQGKFLHAVPVSWSSSDLNVVTIDEKGLAKAMGPGHAIITAKAGEVKAEARIEVQAVGKVTVEPTEGLTLDARGKPKPIVVAVYDLLGHRVSDRHAVARCASEDVCRVFADKEHGADTPGETKLNVHGVDSGETTLEVSCEGATARIPIKVLPTEEERLAKGIGVDGPRKGPQKK